MREGFREFRTRCVGAVFGRLCLLAMIATAASGAAFAAGDGISSIVVKFRDDAGATVYEQMLPSGTRQAIAATLGTGFVEAGRTRDGAFMIALQPELLFVEARAAVNRIRGIASVLYANVVAPAADATSRRIAAVAAANAPRTNRLIVKYRDPAIAAAALADLPLAPAAIDRLSAVLGETVQLTRAMSGGAYVLALRRWMTIGEAEAAAAKIALEPDVDFAEPDVRSQHTLVPNDTSYASQWDLFEAVGGINAPAGWNTTIGAAGGIVAVIDTGFTDHPDLAGRFVSAGYDFIYDYLAANDNFPLQPASCTPVDDPFGAFCVSSRDGDAHDAGDWITNAESNGTDATLGWFFGCPAINSTWHGTHVSGTIAAATNNAAGIAGIDWLGKILPLRALGKCGGWNSDIADAIVWASGGFVPGAPANPTPARVMNLSLGGSGKCSLTFQNAINTALVNNAVVVVAAGNNSADAGNFQPSGCNGVITVAATQRTGARAAYSNFGVTVEIAAPGGGDGNGVLSTLNTGVTTPGIPFYRYYEGTSMATPHVVAVASLILGLNPSLTPAQVLSKLQTTARAFPSGTGRDCSATFPAPVGAQYCGAGIVDMAAAVASACASCATTSSRLLVPDGTSLQQAFTSYPETRWFALGVEPGKTYVVEAVDPSSDLTANALGTLGVYALDGVSAPAEASVDCTSGIGPRPPAVDVASDGLRCVIRTAPPSGTLLDKRPVYLRVTRMDPAAGGGSQFKIRARESTVYGRWLTDGYNFHVEVENTTADPTCVEVARYPASGLAYTPGPGWTGSIASFTMTVPAFGAANQMIPNGSLVGVDSAGTMRIGACGSPVNLLPGGLHVSTYAIDPAGNRYIHFFTSTANDGRTRGTW